MARQSAKKLTNSQEFYQVDIPSEKAQPSSSNSVLCVSNTTTVYTQPLSWSIWNVKRANLMKINKHWRQKLTHLEH